MKCSRFVQKILRRRRRMRRRCVSSANARQSSRRKWRSGKLDVLVFITSPHTCYIDVWCSVNLGPDKFALLPPLNEYYTFFEVEIQKTVAEEKQSFFHLSKDFKWWHLGLDESVLLPMDLWCVLVVCVRLSSVVGVAVFLLVLNGVQHVGPIAFSTSSFGSYEKKEHKKKK